MERSESSQGARAPRVRAAPRSTAQRSGAVLCLDRLPADLAEQSDQLIDGALFVGVPDVDDLIGRRLKRGRSGGGLRRVSHVTERARLRAIALDSEGLTALETGDELRDHVIPAHARPIHVVVAQHGVLGAGTPGVVKNEELSYDLAPAVREPRVANVRDRRGYLFGCGDDLGCRVDLGRRCEDQAANSRADAGPDDFESSSDVHV